VPGHSSRSPPQHRRLHFPVHLLLSRAMPLEALLLRRALTAANRAAIAQPHPLPHLLTFPCSRYSTTRHSFAPPLPGLRPNPNDHDVFDISLAVLRRRSFARLRLREVVSRYLDLFFWIANEIPLNSNSSLFVSAL
jgi:hypothetical protein